VTLIGSHFTAATAVAFGGVPATWFAVSSDTALVAQAPPQAAGTVDVIVTTPYGTSSAGSADQFAYVAPPTVASLSPTAGLTLGRTAVTITGSNFTGATVVWFGGAQATSFTVNSDTSLTAVAPAQAAGTVAVVVTTPYGTSATTPADQFTYALPPAPAVNALSPASGLTDGGTVVTITGTAFYQVAAVSFGDRPATFTVNSDTSITATAPAQFAGGVDVTVTTDFGISLIVPADQFTYLAGPAPAVSGIGPASGLTAGGAVVTITGSQFRHVAAVAFGDATAAFVVDSDTQITAWAPAHPEGVVDVTVTTYDGVSATSGADQFTYGADAGLTAAGTAVTATEGQPFTGAVASFTDGDPNGQVGDFTATIAWGDGNLSVGTIAADGSGGFTVAGTHTYAEEGAYPITVQIQDVGGSRVRAYSTATVVGAAPVIAAISPSSGPSAGGTTVTITGVFLDDTLAVYFGTIPSPGFTVNPDGSITAQAPPGSRGAWT
jgi:hypothetical protein